MTQHSLYQTWFAIIKRCKNPSATGWHLYGGRGIDVCDRWLSFDNFVSDMGPRPSPEHTVDRVDVDGNYAPDNCRWASRLEQAANRRNNVSFVRDGVRYVAAEVAHAYGIQCQLVAQRARKGKTFAEIVSRHHLEPGYDKRAEAVVLAAKLHNERTHCVNGHEMTPENTGRQKNGRWRYCRVCSRQATNASRHRRMAAKGLSL